MIEVPGRLHSKATDHVVTGANEIYDDEQNKKQSEINAEQVDAIKVLNEAVGIDPGSHPLPDPYADMFNGMNRVILPKNIVEVEETPKNLLTQNMFYKMVDGALVPNTNSIFIIQHDYELAEDITVPENSVLEFDGGSVSGSHTITGNNTGIKAGIVKIFDTNVILAGSWNVPYGWVEWFGAKGDGQTDDTDAIQSAINNIGGRHTAKIVNVYLCPAKTYCISKTLVIGWGTSFGGYPTGFDMATYYNFHRCPTIKAISPVDIIKLGETYVNDVTVHDLSLVGYNKNTNSAIVNGENPDNGRYVSWCVTLNNIRIQDVKYGIYSNKVWFIEVSIKNVLCYEQTVGIGIYIINTNDDYIWNINVEKCQFYCYIGGAYIKGHTTSAVNFRDCTFERCGQAVPWEDYDEYGSFGVRLLPVSELLVNIDHCYFERNGALWYNGQNNHDDYVVATKGDMTYITNPDLTKTGDVVLGDSFTDPNTCPRLNVSVHDSIFAIAYQCFIINRVANCHIYDNRYVLTAYGVVSPDVLATNHLIHVVDPVYYGYNVSIKFEQTNTYKYFNANFVRFLDNIKEVVGYSNDSISDGYNIDVNFPQMDRVYSHYTSRNGNTINGNKRLYIANEATSVSFGTPCAPFTDFNVMFTKLDYYGKNKENVTGIHFLTSYTNPFFRFINAFVTADDDCSITASNGNINIQKSSVVFKNMSFVFNENAAFYLRASNATFINCTFTIKSNAVYTNPFIIEGDCAITFNCCTFVREPGSWSDDNLFLLSKDATLNVDEYNSTLANFKLIGTIDRGTTAERPTYPINHGYKGLSFFDTTIMKQLFWSDDTTQGDNGWVDVNGNHPNP